jgi:hypothetical protein
VPTKRKPKWGWKSGGRYYPFYLSEEDCKRIARAIGLRKLDKSTKRLIEYALTDFFIDKSYYLNVPKLGEVKVALEAIQESTRKNNPQDLIALLKKLDDHTANTLLLRFQSLFQAKQSKHGPGVGHRNISRNRKELIIRAMREEISIERLCDMISIDPTNIQLTREATKATLRYLPVDGGGQPQMKALHVLIQALEGIYQTKKGKMATIGYFSEKGRYNSQFYRFVIQCLKAIGEIQGYTTKKINNKFGQHIYITFKKTRKTAPYIPDRFPTTPSGLEAKSKK